MSTVTWMEECPICSFTYVGLSTAGVAPRPQFRAGRPVAATASNLRGALYAPERAVQSGREVMIRRLPAPARRSWHQGVELLCAR